MKETLFYTIDSDKEYVDDNGFFRLSTENNKVFAKAIKEVRSKDILQRSPNYYKYYVKCSPNKTLHDPFPIYSSSVNRSSFVDKVCKSENSFIEVNQSVFNKYINFLKSGQKQWLTEAQRELK